MTMITITAKKGVIMLDDFLIRAALAGIGVALATGGLGAFVVWRRMAYFGDAASHGAILGVALAIASDGPVWAWVLIVALAMGVALQALVARGQASDTVLGVLAHTALAAGLVAVSFQSGIRVDLSAYLFGDILTVSRSDLAVIWGGALLVSGVLLWRWHRMLTATLHEDLARASGVNPAREQMILTLLMAIVVAVALKVVGALLITALLIIPAATAGRLAKSPEMMVALGTGIGALSVLGGLGVSMQVNTPVGPTAVCLAAVAFVIATGLRPLLNWR